MQVEVSVNGDPTLGIVERLLHDGEEPDRSRHAKGDESELAEGPLPFSDAHTFLGEEVLKEISE